MSADPPRTDWLDLAVMSRDDDEYQDEWGTILDDENFARLDRETILSGTYDGLPDEAPHDGAKYHATDVNAVFSWNADAGEWTVLNSGTAVDPVPGTTHVESVRSEDLYTDSRDVDILVLDRGDEYVAIGESGRVDDGSDGRDVLQSAFDYASPGDTVYVRGKYSVDSSLEITTDLNVVLDAHLHNETSDEWAIRIVGSDEGNLCLRDDTPSGTRYALPSTTSGIEKGDLVSLESDALVQESDSYQGETSKVRHVGEIQDDDGNTRSDGVLVDDPFWWTYDDSDGGCLRHIKPVSVTIRGGKITGDDPNDNSGGITVVRGDRCVIEDCEIERLGLHPVRFAHSNDGVIRNCDILESGTDGVEAGYGVQVRGACTNIRIHDNTIRRCRHAVGCISGGRTGRGGPKGVKISDNYMTGISRSVVDAHGSAVQITAEGNEIHCEENTAFEVGACHNRIVDNTIHSDHTTWFKDRMSRQAYKDRTFEIKDNTIYGRPRAEISDMDLPNSEELHVEFEGNHQPLSGRRHFRLYVDVVSLVVRNNLCRGYDDGIVLGSSTSPVSVQQGEVIGNHLEGFDDAIQIEGASNLVVARNHISDIVGDGIVVTGSDCVVEDNVLRDVAGSSVVDDGSNNTVQNNHEF